MTKYKIIDLQLDRDDVLVGDEKDVIGFAFNTVKDRYECAEPDDEWANGELKEIVEKGEKNLTFQEAKDILLDWWEYMVEET